MFKIVKQQLQANFNKMLAASEHLFYVTIDREIVWDNYLHAFEIEEQQSHNCNCCKSFLRQYSGIVAIIDNKRVSIWDNMDVPEEYKASILNLSNYIHSLPITDVFVSESVKCGISENFDSIRKVTWEHFSLLAPVKFVKKSDQLDSFRGDRRNTKEMLQRALKELTINSTETVLDLIAQNSLYRGKESEPILGEFIKIQKQHHNMLVSPSFKWGQELNYYWVKSLELSEGICKIRNTAIGTLLINLSEGMELDAAVGKFEAVVAPANYKRPTALVTPKMVEQAKEKLIELDLIDSLERRYANETDLNVNDVIYTDKSSSVTDVFGEMSKEALVNPKSFSKIEEVSIVDFVDKIIPTSKSIEVLVENNHLSNLVSIVTSVNPEAKSLFKWDNNFSWSYTGGITDSIKERVKAAGGKVDGVLRFSIQWNDEDTPGNVDFDAHAWEPDGTKIMYNTHKGSGNSTKMSGNLDVDMINPPREGVENIIWSDLSKMKDGSYRFAVHNFNGNRNKGFKAQIEFNGEMHDFHYPKHADGVTNVATVTLKNGVFTIKTDLDSTSAISSKSKWGIKTNQFVKVKKVMNSPNYWNSRTGNKHYMFLLDGCVADEPARPFFNEFLKPEFDENRKVFEIMGGKMKVEHTDNQLSGVGFSETQRNHLIVKVTGTFARTIKVNF